MLTPVTAKKIPPVPPIQVTVKCDSKILNTVLENENRWLNKTHRLIGEAVQIIDDQISWAAFHTNKQQPCDCEVSITIRSSLPLFPDDSKSVTIFICPLCNS